MPKGRTLFERFTEKARRIIFFARYEASKFASKLIESEHLLLGILREDKPLADHFFKTPAAIDSIRHQVEEHTPPGSPVSTTADLPLSHESRRILTYAAEEAGILGHRHIGPPHLLLGILRESNCFAARLLSDRQVDFESARAYARRDTSEVLVDVPERRAKPPSWLLSLLADREKAGDITVAVSANVAGHPVDVAVYAGNDVLSDGTPLTAPEETGRTSPVGELSALRKKIRFCVEKMENAIATHEFEKARFYSAEERRLREELEQLRGQLPEAVVDESSTDAVPFLCILLLGCESLSKLRSRIEAYLGAGVAHIWMLDPADKRAYTATTGEGLREMTGDVLRITQPRLEIEWKRMFG